MIPFTPTTLFGSFLMLLGAILTGTIISPLTDSMKLVVSGGTLAIGFISFYLGVEYGRFIDSADRVE
ncbi:hypothetical protein [Haladaptatus sp. DYF46]|uniref:hypothetical protein n=1 Tax=Haladaptatus sp. DYF46 TaxID=2886041 RepID=UPI001E4C86AC|nr:hypothetical protein [Haladaptatus sp. DYF46]